MNDAKFFLGFFLIYIQVSLMFFFFFMLLWDFFFLSFQVN